MAEEPHVIRGINWRETFPFTHIFRSFRIAIHPSKLVLGLLALLCLYAGGRVLDAVWRTKDLAVVDARLDAATPSEIYAIEQDRDIKQYREEQAKRGDAAYSELLRKIVDKPGAEYAALADPQKRLDAARQRLFTRDVNWRIVADRDAKVNEIKDKFTNDKEKDKSSEAQAKALEARDNAIRAAYKEADDQLRAVKAIRGYGLFETLFTYERDQINRVCRATLAGNWVGGMPGKEGVDPGVLRSVYNFFIVGPGWALRYHPLYFVLFGLWFLLIWSLFGGAIARISAVHVADEGRKLSIRQGLKFSSSKFLSFVSAPLIPLLIIGAIGVLMALVGGLLFLLRLEVLAAIAFFLALAAGFVMALVVVGTAAGFNLMYPTIAVEGSDSFDAISRSFSYIYAKPWRMLFYSLVALVYGVLTYVFVKFFIWLVLWLTHASVGLLIYRTAPGETGLWDTLWPTPLFGKLTYEIPYSMLGWYGDVTATILAFWVYLLVALAGAYAISLYFSSNTIIYYLMRREVDATEMDDVYLEQPEEEFVETPAPAAAGTETPAAGAETAGVGASAATAPTTKTEGEVPGEGGDNSAQTPPATEPPASPPGA